MRILVVGGTGLIGRAVVEALRGEHEVVTAARSGADLPVDMTSKDSIAELYRRAGRLDAVVSCAGGAAFRPFAQLTDEDFAFSLGYKLMGQINLVRLGLDSVSDGGSFTLTSGVLAHEPMQGSVAVSLVNAGLEGFTRAAALDLPRGLRINVVSPPWVSETLQAMGQDPAGGEPAAEVAKAYLKSLEPGVQGQVLDARDFA
jgi:NAD(P)-dependent dehydrogenase (short-subunit alcohol dehydrogenase family)